MSALDLDLPLTGTMVAVVVLLVVYCLMVLGAAAERRKAQQLQALYIAELQRLGVDPARIDAARDLDQ